MAKMKHNIWQVVSKDGIYLMNDFNSSIFKVGVKYMSQLRFKGNAIDIPVHIHIYIILILKKND